MKNPYNFFTSDSYTKTEIYQLVYNITVSGVTQQQLDDAISTFRTSDQIDTSYSAATSTYLTLEEINVTGSAYTDGFITNAEIDSKVAGFVTDFLTPSEVDVVFSAHTENLVTESEAQTQIDNAVEVSEDYWHPAPYYERTLITDAIYYDIGNAVSSEVDVILSGNTPWEITSSPPWTTESHSYGTGTTVITLTTDEQGPENDRQSYLVLNATDVAGTPLYITINQLGSGSPE